MRSNYYLSPITALIALYFYLSSILNNMSEHALDWLRDKAIGWTHKPPVNKIDTHHHLVPSFYAKGTA